MQDASADLFDLTGKIAVVTGGGSGLGRANALAFARNGAEVVIVDLNQTAAENVAAEVNKIGRKALAIKADIRSKLEVQKIVDATIRNFGHIDILLNSAGIAKVEGPAESVSEKDWDDTIGANLKGTFLCCQAVGRVMISQKKGKIINMASTDGQMGVPGELSYTASKGGVISLTKTLAVEWAKYNINVNALGPTDFETPMNIPFLNDKEWVKLAMSRIPLVRARARFGRPEEITGAAIFLASEASNLVTGHVLNVDGGRTIE